MIRHLIDLATGTRTAVAVAVLALGGSALFRLSPYAAIKGLLGGASLPEEMLTSPDRLAEVLAALGATGRDAYLQFQLWDLLNPVLMGAAGALLLGWLLNRGQRATSNWRFVVLLPVLLLAADLTENLVLSIAVGAFPARAAVGAALPFVTAVKFGAAFSTMVAVLLLVLMWFRDRAARGPTGQSRPSGGPQGPSPQV